MVAGVPLLMQPDTDTYLIMVASALAMFITAGGRYRDVFLMFTTGVLLVAILALTRPYIRDRIDTFINPSHDPQGSGYQINQSLIAVGSGGIMGRGFVKVSKNLNTYPSRSVTQFLQCTPKSLVLLVLYFCCFFLWVLHFVDIGLPLMHQIYLECFSLWGLSP